LCSHQKPRDVRNCRAAQPFRALDGTRRFGIGKHNAKLITAIARNDIGAIGHSGPQE
jgi:hypothetical protein